MTGDERYPGFHEFVAARSPSLARSAYLLTGDAHAAEDLVQEALARVTGRWRAIAATGDPEPYVRKVLYTVFVSRWRRERRRPLDPHAAEGPDEAEEITSRIALRRSLARLSARQRAVLVLRFYEDLTVAETAAVLGVSTSTVKSQTADALANLRAVGGVTLANLYEGVPR